MSAPQVLYARGSPARQRRPNFQALLDARDSCRGLRSHEDRIEDGINEKTSEETNGNSGKQAYAEATLSSADNQSEKDISEENNQKSCESGIPLDNAWKVEDDQSTSTEGDESKDKIKDEIDQIILKIKREYSFNDWQTAEAKLRRVFEEDRLTKDKLNVEIRDKDDSIPTAKRNIGDLDEEANSHVDSNIKLDGIKVRKPSVISERQKTIVESSASEAGNGSKDRYTSIEAYADYMASHRDPLLALKWGSEGQKARYGDEITSPKVSTSNENKIQQRKKNVHYQNDGATALNTNAMANTNKQKGLHKKSFDEKEENEPYPHQAELEKWFEEADKWAKENGFPGLTSDEGPTNLDDQATPGSEGITGQGRASQGLELGGIGAGQLIINELLQRQSAAGRGRGRGMSAFPPQGRQGHGRGIPGTPRDYDPANIDRNSKEFLRQVMTYEYVKAIKNSCPKSDGMCTVIIVETSDRMLEKMIDIGQFLTEFISGIEANKTKLQLEENIAVITVGAETQVLQHLTTDYEQIRRAIDSLQFEGNGHMCMGLLYIEAVLSGHSSNGISIVNGHAVTPRIILMSSAIASQKEKNELEKNEFAERLQHIAEQTKAVLYCVPIGQSDKDFLDSVATMTGGKLMTLEDANLMSRSYIHHHAAGILTDTYKGDINDRASIEALLKDVVQDCSPADVDCVLEIISHGEPDLEEKKEMEESAMQKHLERMQLNDHQNMERMIPSAMQKLGAEDLLNMSSQPHQNRLTLDDVVRALQSEGRTGAEGTAADFIGFGPGAGPGAMGNSRQTQSLQEREYPPLGGNGGPKFTGADFAQLLSDLGTGAGPGAMGDSRQTRCSQGREYSPLGGRGGPQFTDADIVQLLSDLGTRLGVPLTSIVGGSPESSFGGGNTQLGGGGDLTQFGRAMEHTSSGSVPNPRETRGSRDVPSSNHFPSLFHSNEGQGRTSQQESPADRPKSSETTD